MARLARRAAAQGHPPHARRATPRQRDQHQARPRPRARVSARPRLDALGAAPRPDVAHGRPPRRPRYLSRIQGLLPGDDRRRGACPDTDPGC